MPKQPSILPDNYDSFVQNLKERIHAAQVRASLAVNKELVMLYWQIGKEILTRQQTPLQAMSQNSTLQRYHRQSGW